MANKNVLEEPSGSEDPKVTESTPLIPKNVVEGSDDPVPQKGPGLSMEQATFLISGEMVGGGVLALPRALTKTGWIGVPLIVLTCLMAAFSTRRLSECWALLEARNPQLQVNKKNPYTIIAELTLGKTWGVVVSMALVVTQFGISVVYLLLAGEMVEQVFQALLPTFSLCLWYLIVTGAVTPLLLLGKPKDFSALGIIAFFSAVASCVLYFIEIVAEYRPFAFRWGIHGFTDFFLAIGIIMFSFGGAASFPTIQNDMADRRQFNKSLQYSFMATLIMYLPIAVGGYTSLGDAVAPNIAVSLRATPLTLVANVCMAAHLVSTFVIIINPLCQEVEEIYKTPRDSLGYRILIRVTVMLAILFIGASIPRFYTILALVGGTTIGLLTFVLPSFCYLKLINMPSEEENDIATPPRWVTTVCWQVMALGAAAGLLASVSALIAMFGTSQAIPCYLR